MSKPPQSQSAPSAWQRIPRNIRAVACLFGIGLVLGAVMPLGRTMSMIDGEFGSAPAVRSAAFLMMLVAVAVLAFLLGARSHLTGDIPRTTVVLSVMLGGAASLMTYVAMGYPLSVVGLIGYYVLLVLALILLGQGLHELVQRNQRFLAWFSGAVGLYLLFSLASLFLPAPAGHRAADFGILLQYVEWDLVPRDVISSLVVAAVIPMTTLVVGRALRTHSDASNARSQQQFDPV